MDKKQWDTQSCREQLTVDFCLGPNLFLFEIIFSDNVIPSTRLPFLYVLRDSSPSSFNEDTSPHTFVPIFLRWYLFTLHDLYSSLSTRP